MSKQIISLARLRKANPDEWRESVLTICEYSPRVEDSKSGIPYHQADVITVGRKRQIKFWCKEHFKEASEYARYA